MDNINYTTEKERLIYYFTYSGIIFLASTLLLISFPRSWSLYPLGLFLFSGLVLWIADFRNNIKKFISNWHFIVPPLIYFIIHLSSILFQGGVMLMLENRLMFFLVPLFGIPIFYSDLLNRHIIIFFKAFSFGILAVCILILLRSMYLTLAEYNYDTTIFHYIQERKDVFFFTKLSVFEHPSYLAMKINWVIILIAWFKSGIIKNSLMRIIIFSFLSVVVFLLASKSGIILWFLIMIGIIIRSFREKSLRSVFYFVSISLFLILSYVIIVDIDRISHFVNAIKTGLANENIDWKNLDQRTREWYSALQLINEKPISGIGLARVENRMVMEYIKNGWKDEAFYRFNAHNQYLEAQMTFGIIGTISLLYMLIIPLIMRRRTFFPCLTTIFVILFSFQLIFESMLNRQWGIMFFLLFYFILSKHIPTHDLA